METHKIYSNEKNRFIPYVKIFFYIYFFIIDDEYGT